MIPIATVSAVPFAGHWLVALRDRNGHLLTSVQCADEHEAWKIATLSAALHQATLELPCRIPVEVA